MSVNKNDNQNWSKEEKIKLYEAIKQFGYEDVVSISRCLSKSPEEVTTILKTYFNQINLPSKNTTRVRGNKNIKTHSISKKNKRTAIPLYHWAKFITDQIPAQCLEVETAAALRLIANFESIPKSDFTDGFNFKDVYLSLADALEGKPFKLSNKNCHLLRQCLVDTALYSKAFKRNPEVIKKIESMSVLSVSRWFNINNIEDAEVCYVQHFIKQQAYNPLEVGLNSLKPNLDCNVFE